MANWVTDQTTQGHRLPVQAMINLTAQPSPTPMPSPSPTDDVGATWHWVNPRPQGNFLNKVTYGSSTFVAVGEYGATVTSPDGVAWTARDLGTSSSLYGVTYGNATFVAVGSNNGIFTSPDGVTWTEMSSVVPTGGNFSDVAYGNSTFVAVQGDFNYDYAKDYGTYEGTSFTSPDGVKWTKRTLGKNYFPSGITYGNSTFVVFGYGSEDTEGGMIFTSPDGVTWTKRFSDTLQGSFTGVAYGNSTFVVVGSDGTIVTSPDGVKWTKRTLGKNNFFVDVTYGNATFVAVGEKVIFTSPDGVTWTDRSSSNTEFITVESNVTYDNSKFMILDSRKRLLTSTTGEVWMLRDLGLPIRKMNDKIHHLAYVNSIYVAQYEYVDGPIHIVSRIRKKKIASHSNLFDYQLYTSADGETWTPRFPATHLFIQRVTYGNAAFVAVGEYGLILRSGSTATTATTPTPAPTPSACVPTFISASPAKLTRMTNDSGDVTVTVTGNGGCAAEGITVKATTNKAGAKRITISPSSADTDSDGKATFTITAKNKPGSAKATFTAGSLSKAITMKIEK